MRARHWLLCVLALAVPLALPLAARADWTPIGGSLNVSATGNASAAQVADVGGVPYVVFTELAPGTSQIYVRQWNGSAWVLDGGSLNVSASDSADGASIANVGGVPYVALSENNGAAHVLYVKQWNGSSWVQDGGALNIVPSESVAGFSIADIAGRPWVALDETAGISHHVIYVVAWNGSGWSAVGNVGNTNASPLSNPSLASIGGTPYVAWSEGSSAAQIDVKSWNGSSWVAAGGPVDPIGGSASSPSLADVGGQPYLGWFYDSGVGSQAAPFVSALEGASWALVSDGLGVNFFNPGPASLAVTGGVPMFAYAAQDASSHRDIRVQALHGGTWSTVGGPLNPVADDAATPALASVAGVPFAVWSDVVGSTSKIRAAALEPTFDSEQTIATDTGALLSVRVSDYGAALPITFQYGAGALMTSTTTQTTDGSGSATITLALSGLKPSTTYSWQAISPLGSTAAASSPVQTFTTEPANGPGAAGAPGQIELVVCKRVTKTKIRRVHHKRKRVKVTVQKCTSKLVSGPVTFKTSAAGRP